MPDTRLGSARIDGQLDDRIGPGPNVDDPSISRRKIVRVRTGMESYARSSLPSITFWTSTSIRKSSCASTRSCIGMPRLPMIMDALSRASSWESKSAHHVAVVIQIVVPVDDVEQAVSLQIKTSWSPLTTSSRGSSPLTPVRLAEHAQALKNCPASTPLLWASTLGIKRIKVMMCGRAVVVGHLGLPRPDSVTR